MREKRCKGMESLTQLILLNKINFRMMFEAGIADEVDHVPCEKEGSSSLNVKDHVCYQNWRKFFTERKRSRVLSELEKVLH
jgi:hypothetical protein